MLRTLLALITHGRGRHRNAHAPRTAALSAPLDPVARGARIVRHRSAQPSPCYVPEAEQGALIRPYFLAFEEQTRQARVEERAA
jgi:hypothetical protein